MKRGRPNHFGPDEARAIYRAYWDGHSTMVDLAKRYGVSRLTIFRLCHGHTYSWLKEEKHACVSDS